jgi:hypothetical protein
MRVSKSTPSRIVTHDSANGTICEFGYSEIFVIKVGARGDMAL